MKAREYAISLGLAKATRGKLSKEAHAAIQIAIQEGHVFDDYKDGRVVKNDNGTNRPDNSNRSSLVVSRVGYDSTDRFDNREAEVQEIKSNPVIHDYSVIYGIEVIRLNRPVVIAYEYCSKCFLQVKYCVHDVPKLPAYLGGGDGLIHYPTEEDKQLALDKANEANPITYVVKING